MDERTREKLQEFLEMLEFDERVAKKFGDHKAERLASNYRQDFLDLLKELDN